MKCENVREYYYDYLHQIEAVPSEITAHIKQCSVCVRELERLTELLQKQPSVAMPLTPEYLQCHYQLLDRWASCDLIKPLLPSLLISELELKHRTPVTAHIENCPECQKSLRSISSLGLSGSQLMKAGCYLARSQDSTVELEAEVRQVLDEVKDKDGSIVLTRLRATSEHPEQEWVADSFVTDVEYRQPQPAQSRPVTRRHAVSAWAASGIAAAILFAILLVLQTGDVKALDVNQLYMSLENVRNAHIQKFDGPEELESIWIAEGLGAYLFQRNENAVFVDTHSGEIFQQRDGAVQLTPHQSKMELERPWGLLPFKKISELPESYDWEYISDGELEGGLKVKIYEWSWEEILNNQTEVKKIWRGYLDTHSHLPYRIEWMDRVGDLPAELIMEMKISYPSDAECLDVLESYGFEKVTYGDQDGLLRILPTASKVGSTEEGFILSTWPSAKTALIFPRE